MIMIMMMMMMIIIILLVSFLFFNSTRSHFSVNNKHYYMASDSQAKWSTLIGWFSDGNLQY